jgi:hypothetical protein
MAYSGMSWSTLPLKTISSTIENSASATMPLVKASRSPRNWNRRGRKRSLARIEARRGKSANEVLAASTRIRAVAICSSTYSGLPSPSTTRPNCESTVSSSAGRMPICMAT